VREAVVQRVPRILAPALVLRLLVWVPLLLLSLYAAAETATQIQNYLHQLGDGHGCWPLACPDDAYIHAIVTRGPQYVIRALLWSGIAYLAAVAASAIYLLRWRIIANTTRFVLALLPIVLPWLWVFPLVLSAASALVSVAHLSQRAPVPQPDLVTLVLLAVAGLSVAPRVVRRVRSRRQARTKTPR